MANSKTKRTKSSRFGRRVRKSSVDQSLRHRSRPRLELLEPRLAPSVNIPAPPNPGIYVATADAIAKAGDRLPAGVPLRLDSNQHVVFGPYQAADFLRQLTPFQQQIAGATEHLPVQGPQQMPNSPQDVGDFRVNPDGTVSPNDGTPSGASNTRVGQLNGPILADPPGSQAPQQNNAAPHGTSGRSVIAGQPASLLGPHPAGMITVGASFDGIDFNGSNCGCLPPDTNADVSSNYVFEVVNIQARVFDKAGNVLLDEPLQTLFGAPTGGDPYVVYDDIANRWYVSAFDSSDSGLFLAVSKDANPLDGFMPTYDLTNVGGFPDYNKMGFNKDAIFISFNNFGNGGAAATVASIDKAAALSGTLNYFVSTPPQFQFRAMPPARMHGDTTGGVEWFVSTDGTDSGGTTMRVTELTNYLSNSPVYTLTSLPVAQYQSAGRADQPGAPFGVTTFPNTTTYEVQYRNGHLVTAMASSTAADGFTYPKGLYYEVDVSGGTPVLQRQGVIDPGAGVAVQMPSVDVDPAGNLGLTWFESSLSEYLSMWVGSVDPAGNLTSFDAAPGGGFFPYSFRIGDYSSLVYDPSSGSFWGANEYIGNDGFSDIWRTHITSFHTQLAVTSSDPAANSIINTTPTDFTITWSDAIDPNSLNANDLTVNGIAANSVTLSPDFLTTVFHYDVSPVTAEGLQSMDIGANTIRRLSDGTGNLPFDVHFRYDPSPMSVTATNPAAGALVDQSGSTENLILTFSEPFDASTINTGNITVSLGTVTAATVVDSTHVDYTISNITTEGTESYSLAAGAVNDADGNPVLAYSSNFIVNILVSPYPTPLAGEAPLGSLIYDPSVSAGIQFAGDTDSFTINLNPGQTITVDLKTDPSLQGQIDVFNPGGTNIGEVIASGAGAEVVLGPVATDPPTPGIYTIQISGANSTTGNFTAQLVLNAALDSLAHGGADNSTLATAQSLDSPNAFINTGSGSSRAAVLGTSAASVHAGPDPFGYEAIAVAPTFTDISSDPNAHAILQGTDDSGYYVPFSSLSDPATGNPFSFNFYGQTYSGTSDSLHDHMFINTDGWMTFQYYEAYYYFGGDFSAYPVSAAIGPMWNDTIFIGNGAVYYEVTNPSGSDPQLVIEWQNVQGYYYPGQGLTFEMVLDQNTGHIQFNYGNIAYGTPYDNGAAAGVGIKDLGYGTPNHLTISYQNGPNAFIGSNQSTLIGLNIVPPADTDYYSFHLNAGESATIAAKGLAGGGLDLLDSSGNVLAVGATGFAKLDEYIKSFVAPSDGTYYVEAIGNPNGGNYSLVVTKNADFDHGGNNQIASAQSLDGTHTVLGAIGKAGALYGLEWEPNFPLLAHIMDPATGAFQNTIGITAGFITNPFGENMAFDGTNLYYNDGPFFGDNRIYKIDPATGNVLSSILPQEPFYLFGIAWFNGALWATDDFDLYELDPNTGAVLQQYNGIFDGATTGLTADPDNGMLYAVSQFRQFFVVNPATGQVVNRAPDNPLYYEQDLAYANGELFVSEAFVPGVNTISVYDANTLQLKRRLSEPGVANFIGGLGGDGLGGTDAHYYSFNASDGNNLTITDTAFNSSEAGGTGEFANGLQPVLALFDSSGTQVATATDNGSGVATINYTVPAGAGGTYYVEATAQNKTLGEYTLDVEGATGAATPFTVTATDPANGANLQSVSQITVAFSESVLVSSLANADFTIDGNAAASFTVVNDHTVTFFFGPLPTGAEDNVAHNWVVSGVQDLQGDTVQSLSGSFLLDNVPPSIVSDTITEGQIFTDGTSIQEVVTFSESMNTALVSASSFQLQGTYRNATYSGAFSWTQNNTVLTITYSNLPDDGYTLTLFGNSFQDPVGLTLVGGNFTRDFVIDATGPTAMPTPVQSVNPLGSLVYTTSTTGVVLPTGDRDTFTINLNAGQHLTIDATAGSTFDAHILVKDPTNHIIAHGDGATPGAEVLMQSIPITNEGTYQIVVSGLLNTLGYYSLNLTLNAALELSAHGGPSNSTQGSSQDLTGAFTGVGFNGESIATVLGQSHGASSDVLWVGPHSQSWDDGSISVTQISIAQFATQSLNGFRLIYVDADARDSGGLDILQSRAADIAAFVNAGGGLITDCGGLYFGPDFSWVPLGSGIGWTNDGQNSISITPDGQSSPILAGITSDGLSNWFTSQHNDFFATAGLDVLATDPFGDPDLLAGNFGAGHVVYMGIDPSYHQEFNEGQSRQLIRQAIHWAEAPHVATGGDFFSFDAVAGQSISAAVAAATGHANLTLTLLDSTGTVLALGATGAANVDAEIANFIVPADDTYYLSVGGHFGTPFNLTVTEDAVFDTEKNGTPAQAQDITPTINSTLGVGGAAIGSLSSSAVSLGASIEGIDFNGSNCGCLPPDTNAAVGGNYITEIVNVQIRVFDKTSGSVLLDEPLSTFFGSPSGGDPYVVYDDIANRWYVEAFNSSDSGFFFAVSNDASPLDGFIQYNVTGNSSFPDYPKMGFNKDAIFISFNDFGTDAGATIISIDKAAALSGTLNEFVSKPKFQFRAMPPAQMHGDTTGGVEWFVSTDGTDAGGNTIRVTEMTNYLSNSPVFTYTSLPVTQYQQASRADQPDGSGVTVFPNTTTTQVQFRNGHLVTAMASALAGDGFVYPKGLYYQIDVSSGTPVLMRQGVIDPGAGVAVQMPTVAEDDSGNLGFTWMESSSSENLSMWVGTLSTSGAFASAVAAPGGGPFVVNFRIGDYSSTVLDPDGKTFWSANEYIGSDGSSDIWRTHIESFSVAAPQDSDFYSVNVNNGDNVTISVGAALPGGGEPGSQQASPLFNLTDPNGMVLASGVQTYNFLASVPGTYYIEVIQDTSAPNFGQGDYALDVSGATGAPNPLTVTSTNPPAGGPIQVPTSITVSFSASILLPSVSASDLTITDPTAGTLTATGFTIVDDHTVTFTLPSLPTVGDSVSHTISITGVMGLTGVTVTPFSETITTDNLPPSVVMTSPTEGANLVGDPTTITITWSESMNTAFTTASSFTLQGNFRGASYAPDTFTWSPDGTQLTITYNTLPDDTYTLTLFGSGFEDGVGLTATSNTTLDFTLDHDATAAFPVPLQAVKPLGSLIYDPTVTGVIAPAGDVDSYTINVNAGETITVDMTSSALQGTITLLAPDGTTVIGTASAAAAGQEVVLQTAPAATTGTYTIELSDATGMNIGLFHAQVILNAALDTGIHGGAENSTIATAQDLTASSVALGTGGADRLAVLGGIEPGGAVFGDALVVENSDVALINQSTGQIITRFTSPAFSGLFLFDIAVAPDNTFYVLGDVNFFTAEVIHMDLAGDTLGTFVSPVSDSFGFLSPEGFGLAPDGSFWFGLVNSGNVLHLDASGNFINEYFVGGSPNDVAVGPDGKVYITQVFGGQVQSLDPTTGNTAFFASSPFPIDLTWSVAGNLWVGDINNGVEKFDSSGNLIQQIPDSGATASEPALSGNIWDANVFFGLVNQYDSNGNPLTHTSASLFQPGLAVLGDVPGEAPLVPPPDDYYSFTLAANQSATIALTDLSGNTATMDLEDGSGNVLATATTGGSNVSEVINNFVASSAGTYYVHIAGNGTQYSLVVTRGATFSQKPNQDIAHAQNITTQAGVLGHLILPAAVTIGASFDGIDFNGSNCGCLPPDTNAAVGGNFVVETVNVEIRVFDKGTGNVLLDEPLSTLYGAPSGGDPYVVYDDIANRWYANALDSSDAGFFLAVSNDANPLDGFQVYHLTNNIGGPIPDYPKMGFNKDAIFISYNNFGSGGAAATVVSIDKAAILSGTLTYFVSAPPSFQFRAMPPAQMHGDTTGGTEWFVSTDGTDAGGTTIRVTELQNYLSNSPVYTLTSIPVAQYQNASRADQPGGSVTTFPNTTTTQVQYRNGMLVTAMASATAADGFVYPKGLYYEVNVSGGTPTLVLQGVIDPGTGVAVQMPSVDIDTNGNLGFTWIESSASENLSMWVGTLSASSGGFASAAAAPGGGFFPESFRIGDYSSTVLDPTTNMFWSANEYIGNDGFNDIWLTHITSFSLVPPVSHDFYEIDAAAGATINLATFTPSDQGGEFENTLDPGLALYDANGNLVATETTGGDGRNESINFTVTTGGAYFVDVFNENGTQGDYFLQSSLSGPSAIAGRKFNDLLAQGTDLPSDPGLQGWTINLYDTSGNLVATTTTDANGNYNFTGLSAGTYLVQEVQQSGWTQDYPAAGSYTVAVGAGEQVSGNDFGNWTTASISGRKFNDLNGSGTDLSSDPGLQGWTIDLVNAATGALVDSTTTASDGSYSFPSERPGNYIVEEVQQSGYLQTFPAAPGTYTITATSASSTTGMDFGNFQLASVSGEAFSDVNGNGSLDGGEPGIAGVTINLLDSSGNVVQSTLTDGNGDFSFAGIGPGTFSVQEPYQPGFSLTTPGSYSVTTSSGSATTGLLFGNFQDVTVSGTVYNDMNGNGAMDPGDTGLQGWTVDLVNINTHVIRQLVTDANGNYSFPFVGPGSYTITEELQSGWVQTQPGTPSSPQGYTLSPTSGTNVTDIFGNYELATSAGVVYNDTNGNGTQDPGEPGLSGIRVDLLNAGTVVQYSITDSNGNYLFTNVGPGSYTISEEIPSGYIFTQPAAPYTYAYNPTSGSFTTGQDFGNVQAGTISGRTFNDLNGSGQDLGSDPGLGGWTIDLVNSGGSIVATTTTASDGSYSFTALLGSYTVEEVPQTGYTQTYPAAPGTYSVTLSTGGQTVSGNDFGEFQNISFSGTVFYDRNNDHTQDNGETGISGVQIKLDGTVVATTDSSGNYSISGIGPGNHTVTEVVPSRYVETSPSNDVYSFSAQSGGNQTAQNFANDVPTTTHDNNRQGYNESGGGWVTLNQGWNGTSRTHAATTRHAVYASWNLNPVGGNLPAGTYQVYVTWVPGSDRATNASYQIFDGNNHLIATVRVDQTQAPSGAWYQGFYWQSLGIFNFTANKPSVRLLGSASGSVDADGVLILSTPSSGHPALGTRLTSQNMAAAVLAGQTSGATAGSTQTSSAALTVQPNGVTTDVINQMVGAGSVDTLALIDYLFASTQKQNDNGLGDLTLGQL
jgi:protocatechuate 3,4-dioxygenase beta subunit